MGLGTYLSDKWFGPQGADKERQEAVKEKRRQEALELVKANPDLLKDQDTLNKFMADYERTGTPPAQIPTGQELRIESGQKTETPLDNGRGSAVTFPETDVKPESKPLKFASDETFGVYDPNQKGLVTFQAPSGTKLVPHSQANTPKTMDAVLSQKVQDGELTLEEAYKLRTQYSHSGSSAFALNDDEQAALVKATQREKNPLPTSFITSRGSRAKVLAQALMKNPDYNPTESEISFSTSKHAAEAETGAAGTAIGRIEPAANTLEDILDFAQTYIKGLSPTQIQMVNSAYRRGLAQINDPDANAFLTHINEATGQYAQILKGGAASPTDDDYQKARGVIGLGLSEKGFDAVAEAIRKAARSKVTRLRQQVNRGGKEDTHRGEKSGHGDGEKTPSFATEAAAEAAHLPVGTIIMIGGRRAEVQ